jgi:hypothetical protein
MKYKIEKISLTQEAANELIEIMAAMISEANYEAMEKRPVEFQFQSEDKLIDVWFECSFHSYFKHIYEDNEQGGLKCIERSVKVVTTMTEVATGDEIEFVAPVWISEEVEKRFYI